MTANRKLDISARRSWFRRRNSPVFRGTTKSKQAKEAIARCQDEGDVLAAADVSDFGQQGLRPLWLLRLHTLYRCSSVITFLLVTAMLVVYGWTVYSQQLWSQAYRKLQTLQRSERQLTTNNEVLKNQLAQEAQTSATKLVSPSPATAIFLRPAPENSKSATPNTTFNSQSQQQNSMPLGY
jgi:hypothetical protein